MTVASLGGRPASWYVRRAQATAAAMRRWRAAVGGLTGWRRAGVGFVLGAVAVLALPPVHLVFLLVPSFVGLVWLAEESTSWRGAFAAGWWFGFGYFMAGLYWIAFALLIDPDKFAWMVPFAVFGLAAVFALYTGLATALARACPTAGIGRVFVLAAAWTAAEWLRGWAFTGFPWNPIGSVWAAADGMIQFASVFGAYGLGTITVVAAAMPAVLASRPEGAGRALTAVVAAGLGLALVWAAGEARLASATEGVVPGVRLRLVQPNIAQKLKWQPEMRRHHVELQLEMSREAPAAGGRGPTHVIWAESMVPYFLANEPELLQRIGAAAPANGLMIVGAPRAEAAPGQPFRVWNSLHAIDRQGRILATYDKFHLTPFGEYVPLRRIFRFAKVTEGRGDFSPGTGLATLALPGLPPVSPLICYEIIFPGEVVAPEGRPRWLLNLTNDAWFGRSPGPHQHLAAARLRAVEEGLPVVRVANTGISAVIDAYGRTRASLGLGRQGVIDADLPEAIERPTIYARFANAAVLVLVVAAIAIGFATRDNP